MRLVTTPLVIEQKALSRYSNPTVSVECIGYWEPAISFFDGGDPYAKYHVQPEVKQGYRGMAKDKSFFSVYSDPNINHSMTAVMAGIYSDSITKSFQVFEAKSLARLYFIIASLQNGSRL